MGKRIISQRRGRGTSTYKSYSNRFEGEVTYGAFVKDGVLNGKVLDVMHGRAHSSPLMKVIYENGKETLLPAYNGCYIGKEFILDMRENIREEEVREGSAYLIKNLSEGTTIYNVEFVPGDGGRIARSGGSSVKIVSQLGKFTKILLPSKKTKLINSNCRAIVGVAGGSGRVEKPFVKAGTKYYKMKKTNKLYPRTSGGKMAAHDHPFGNTRSLRKGNNKIAPKNAPPGRKVGMIRPKRTGGKN